MRVCGRGAFAAIAAAALCACGQSAGQTVALPPAQQPSGQDAGPGADAGPSDPSDAGPAAGDHLRSVLLATAEHGPLTLATDDANLYWGTSEEGAGPVLRAMHLSGGEPVTLLALPRQLDLPGGVNHHARIDRLDVDANWIFLSTTESEAVPNPGDVATLHLAGGFYRAAKSGGVAEPFAIPEGFGEAGPFSADDESIYFYEPEATGVTIAAVPKSGGPATTIRLEAPGGDLATVNSISMDAQYWYLSRSNYFGAAHVQCVSRAPRAGGVLEDVWCPDFLVQHLVLAGGLLVGVDAWPSTASPGPWVVNLATSRANPVVRTDKQIVALAADAPPGSLYTVDVSPASEVPLVPAASDLTRIDLASGRRTVLDHGEAVPPTHRLLVVWGKSVLFTRGGDVVRFDP